ncbi:hypothetical protein ACU8KH_05723 [Lachancea thermotolerans]
MSPSASTESTSARSCCAVHTNRDSRGDVPLHEIVRVCLVSNHERACLHLTCSADNGGSHFKEKIKKDVKTSPQHADEESNTLPWHSPGPRLGC